MLDVNEKNSPGRSCPGRSPATANLATGNSRRWRPLMVAGFVVIGIAVIVQAMSIARNAMVAEFNQRIAERLTLYESTIRSELGQFRTIPYLIARSEVARSALRSPASASEANRFLQEAAEDSGVDVIYLMDTSGVTVASSNWQDPNSFVGGNFSFRPYFTDAMAGGEGGFFAVGIISFIPGYFISRPVRTATNEIIGVAVVKVDISDVQSRWRDGGEHVFVTDPLGVVFLASDNDWRYKTLGRADEGMLATIRGVRQYDGKPLPPMNLERTQYHGHAVMDLDNVRYLFGRAAMADPDWLVYYLIPYAAIDKRLNGLLSALVVLMVALGLLILFLRERREKLRSRRQAEDSARIRGVNMQLQAEIVERRRTEQELRNTETELVQTAKLAALGQMSASVAHELNQPLSSLQMNVASARLLLRQGRGEELAEVLGQLEALVIRMARMGKELKSFARRSDGQAQPFDVRSAVDNALMLLEAAVRQADVTVDWARPMHEVTVSGDQLRLEQVLVNLFQNAVDAMKTSGQRLLLVRLVEQAGSVGLVVVDTGPGLPEETQQVFEPFFTTKQSGEGLGLGLSIVERIVHGMGGRILAENLAEGGARFTLSMPRLAT